MHPSLLVVALDHTLSFGICHPAIDCAAIYKLGLVYSKPVSPCIHCSHNDCESPLLDWRSRSHIRMLKVAKLANLSLDSVCEQHWYFVSAPEVNLAWHNWSLGCLTHLLVSYCLAVVFAFAAVVRRTVELILIINFLNAAARLYLY